MTLHQPWASLVALGVKTIETRGWSTNYRGPLAIHAAVRRPDMEMLEDGMAGELFDDSLECLAQWSCTERRDFFPERIPAPRDRWWLALAPNFATESMPLGAVIATCELVEVVPTAEIVWKRGDDGQIGEWARYVEGTTGEPFAVVRERQRPYGDFTPGRFAWLLSNIEPLAEPIPATGKQGLWNWERP